MKADSALTREQKIIGFMTEQAYRPMLKTELALMLDVPAAEHHALFALLDDMETRGLVVRTRNERYGVPKRMSLVTGRLQGHERGFGFVIPDEGEDVYIPADAMNGAMHGDTVMARVSASGTDRSGEIVRILVHANERVVGTFECGGRVGFVVPDHARIAGDILIPGGQDMGASEGQKVVAEILRWPEPHRNAEGRIVEILGNPDEKGVDVLSTIRAYGIRESFPEEVLSAAAAAPTAVLDSDLARRRDLRGLQMVTIDGEDARDLDDAVSLEPLENGRVRLGVHIADVTQYVTEGSALDAEAVLRGTSVYFPDRVVPMLPKELSNGICSLNAGVDRLALSVFMEVDDNGTVLAHEIVETVIHIRERMTYTVVRALLEDDGEVLSSLDEDRTARYSSLLPILEAMRRLALILKEKRKRRGAVDFLFDETKVIVDEEGHAAAIKRYANTIANSIIEEFMLLCNEVVSEHFFRLEVPFVYRIHEDPSPQKMEHLRNFLRFFGYTLSIGDEIHPSALQKVLDQVRGKPEEKAVGMVMLRSLQKARYSHEHVWHFGLAAEYYSHFTSPIRRYPDLIIHRIIKESLRGQLSPKRIAHYDALLPSIAKSSSERERAAADAERDVVDMKKAEFMAEMVGDSFDGTISSIASFGLFVELENTVEGLVRVSSLEDDYYVFDEEMLTFTGERTRRQFRIGDKVRVKLIRASARERQIDFLLEESEDSRRSSGGRAVRGVSKPPFSKKGAAAGKIGMTEGRSTTRSGTTSKTKIPSSRSRSPQSVAPTASEASSLENGRTKSASNAQAGGRRKPVDMDVLAHIGSKKTGKARKKNDKKGTSGNRSRW